MGISVRARPKSRQLQQDLEHITQEMYKRNKELADTNRTLSLLRTIDNLVLDARYSLTELSKEIANAITSLTDYPFVAILGHTEHTPSKLQIYGYSLKKDAFSSPINLPDDLLVHTNHAWFKSPRHSKLIQASEISPEKLEKIFGLDKSETANILAAGSLASVYLVKLTVRNRLVGVIAVGFTHTIHSHDIDGPFIDRLSEAIGVALDNKMLFEENQRVASQLRRTNAKLKALDAAKDEFISMASHQLRTPLTAIKGYLSMILDGDTGVVKPKQKEMIQQSFEGAQRMVYLIADLLNVSRMQTGKFVIDSRPANLAEMIVGEMAQLKDQAEAKKIAMNYIKPDKFPILNLDETKVRQVIMNFLDNALYYTPNGGNVDIKLTESPESVSFTVTDTGVGVPKSVQHNLFTKFYRADNARKMRPDGTGLGLFMAKKVVVAQGGAIIFNSVEGKGSTFGFTFPRAVMEVNSEAKAVPATKPMPKTDPLTT